MSILAALSCSLKPKVTLSIFVYIYKDPFIFRPSTLHTLLNLQSPSPKHMTPCSPLRTSIKPTHPTSRSGRAKASHRGARVRLNVSFSVFLILTPKPKTPNPRPDPQNFELGFRVLRLGLRILGFRLLGFGFEVWVWALFG